MPAAAEHETPSVFRRLEVQLQDSFLLFFLSHIVYFTTINRYIVIQIASHTDPRSRRHNIGDATYVTSSGEVSLELSNP